MSTVSERVRVATLASSVFMLSSALGCDNPKDVDPSTETTEAESSDGSSALPEECGAGSESRDACLGALALECESQVSEDVCSGEWSWTDIPVLAPLGLSCRWFPGSVRVSFQDDSCVLEETVSLCLGAIVDDDINDPTCMQFGQLQCDGDAQTGRPKGRREGGSMLLVNADCQGALVGFETEQDYCYGASPASECSCYCAQ
jgi:hypothetical protein